MSYLVRNQNDVIGPNAAIELPSGAGASTFVGMQLMEPLYFFQAALTAGSQVLFIVPQAPSQATGATPLGAYQLLGVSATFTVTSTSGTLQLTHDTGVSAPGSGTAMLSSALSLSGTANTVVSAVPSTTLTGAQRVFLPGDRLSVTIGGTVTGGANLSVSVYLAKASPLIGGGLAY